MSTKAFGLTSWVLLLGIAISSANLVRAQERREGDRGRPAPAAAPNPMGTFKSADTAAGTITISVAQGRGRGERGDGGREAAGEDKTFKLAKTVEVAAGSGSAVIGRGERSVATGSVLKAVKLSDLAAGVKVSLLLAPDHKTVTGIVADGPTVKGVLKTVDAAKKTVTIQFPGRPAGRGAEAVPGEEKTYPIAVGCEIATDDGRGTRYSVREAKLTDLAQGALVTIHLFVDLAQAQSILVEGPSHQGTIKAIDPAKKTLTIVVRPPNGDDAGEEYSLTVAGDAVVVIDSGKGRLLGAKFGKLGDIPVGAAASVKLSVDQAHVMSIRAEGKTMAARFKSVDPAKGTITIAVVQGRDNEEEKTFTVAQDAVVSVNGHAATLADLAKAGENTTVILRFSLDQQSVQGISSRAGDRGR